MSLLVRGVLISEVEMHARVVLGVGKGVLFREVSSVQECPHREREVPLYICMYSTCVLTSMVCV